MFISTYLNVYKALFLALYIISFNHDLGTITICFMVKETEA
jgi:hypothetical protein